jgi:hypothetical protein
VQQPNGKKRPAAATRAGCGNLADLAQQQHCHCNKNMEFLLNLQQEYLSARKKIFNTKMGQTLSAIFQNSSLQISC